MERSLISQFSRGKDRLQATYSSNQPASQDQFFAGSPANARRWRALALIAPLPGRYSAAFTRKEPT